MDELLKDWFGTIAVLIYILYPIIKRWLDRRKEKKQKGAGEQAPSSETAETPAEAAPPRSLPDAAPSPPEPTAPPETKVDVVAATRAQAQRLETRAQALLRHAQRKAALVRLVPALREDLIEKIHAIQKSLAGSPSMETVAQDSVELHHLEALLRYLHTMAEQRLSTKASVLGDADKMADACYAPILEFAQSHGLELRTSTPMVIRGDWGLSIVPQFADTRVAPLRLPRGFGRSVWLWPAIAHEVAHDLYYSVDGLEDRLHARLALPHDVAPPTSGSEIDAKWLRELYGAWLSEIFADTMGTLMLGPAYVETMHRAFRNPASPQRTAAVMASQGWIDEHPPERLRVYMATRVLHHLGRHQEADALWAKWEGEHPGVDFYFLPMAGQWVGLSDESMHDQADAMVDILLEQSWPELADYKLLNIPGFAYLHADHAEVTRVREALSRGDVVDVDVRWIMAAAVLEVAGKPELEAMILEVASASIVGIGTEPEVVESPRMKRPPTGAIGETLVASLRDPSAVREAIILGTALRPYDRPRWDRPG